MTERAWSRLSTGVAMSAAVVFAHWISYSVTHQTVIHHHPEIQLGGVTVVLEPAVFLLLPIVSAVFLAGLGALELAQRVAGRFRIKTPPISLPRCVGVVHIPAAPLLASVYVSRVRTRAPPTSFDC